MWALQELSPPSLPAVDLWSWSELELEYSRAAELHSELVLLMTTRKSCHLDCLICRLSGFFRELVVGLVQLSGVACVSHDAVRSVPVPSVLLGSRARITFLHVSSVPVFGLFSPASRRSLFQRCARGLSETCLTRSLRSAQCPFTESLSDDNPRWAGAKVLDKLVSASVSCALP